MATSSDSTGSKEISGSFISCDFEISGTVQGVFFRKYTQQQATKLNLVGWVKNAASGTVQGHMEGQKDHVNKMKNWLRTTGSPKSKITKADFSNEKSISQLNGKSFSVNK
jgi:acylphosphatase